jgi:hypothetical protein
VQVTQWSCGKHCLPRSSSGLSSHDLLCHGQDRSSAGPGYHEDHAIGSCWALS